ncbi:MAG: sensor histidine kinase [Aggregatilineales bacterium]
MRLTDLSNTASCASADTAAETQQPMREQFFAVAAHDLRHPISNIYAAQRLLREIVGDNPLTAELLDEIERSLDAMQEIVSDFLETAALEAGALQVQLEPVDVEETLWRVAARYAAAAQKKNIAVEIGAAEGCALADPHRLAQAVGNLLSNALKYSPPGSQVTLTASAAGERVRISVRDQGPGIAPAERNRLFCQFGRASARPTGGESSTGLGLWIVRQLAALQHGQAWAEFPEAGGSVFWLELPAAVPAEATLCLAATCGH